MSIVLKTPKITVNSVDLTGFIDMIKIDSKATDLDSTPFGQTAKRHVGGLLDNQVTLEFLQDFASATVEATIYPLIGLTTTIAVLPNNATTTTTNPSYTFVVLVTDWTPLDAKVGELVKPSITWPIDGGIVKANS